MSVALEKINRERAPTLNPSDFVLNHSFKQASPKPEQYDGELDITAHGEPVVKTNVKPHAGMDIHELQGTLSSAFSDRLPASEVKEMHKDNIVKSNMEASVSVVLATIGCATLGGNALIVGVAMNLIQGTLSMLSSMKSNNAVEKIESNISSGPSLLP